MTKEVGASSGLPSTPKVPKDLGVKMGTPDEANWKGILEQTNNLIVTGKANQEINEIIAKHARLRIAQEKEKFKRMK